MFPKYLKSQFGDTVIRIGGVNVCTIITNNTTEQGIRNITDETEIVRLIGKYWECKEHEYMDLYNTVALIIVKNSPYPTKIL